ncbi:MAG: HAD family hydrolase [Actinocatenispora sp.]
MRYPMIVCDLDGTLLDSSGAVSGRTAAAVRHAQDHGHVFVIATARPVRDTRPVAHALGGHPIAVCGNGSVVFDFGRDEIVSYRPLAHESVGGVLDALRTRFPGIRLGAECGLDLLLEEGFELPPALSRDARRVGALAGDTRGGHGFGKLMVQLDGAADGYHERVRELLTGYEVTVSGGGFCEVMQGGVTKAAALELTAGRLGLSGGDAVAFGDMPNDLPVFAWSATSVAVANAHPTVLAAADEVTASNDEHGVARWLERLCATPWERPSVP